MDYLEDNDFTLHYHPGKENVVVDSLSRKSRGVLAGIVIGVNHAFISVELSVFFIAQMHDSQSCSLILH